MAKSDFLRECMGEVPGAPLDEFNRVYCVRCGNRECARAGAGKLSFDRRAQNWKRELFDEVPRASDDDARFDHIRAKRFIVLQSGPSPVTPAYVPAPVSVPTPVPQPEPVVHAEVPASLPSEPQPLAPRPTAPQPPQPRVGNTSFVQGTVLRGAPEAKEDAETIENNGTFTFGGGDE